MILFLNYYEVILLRLSFSAYDPRVLGYGFCIVLKNWALATIYEEIIINIGCIYDQSHFEIIMSTIQNSHKDSNYLKNLTFN